MTKFTKGIVTTIILVGVGIGGKYGYDYLKEKGVFDKVETSNVSENTVIELQDYLNESMNIGFVQINYNKLDINSANLKTIISLLYNPYEKGSDGTTTEIKNIETNFYKEYVTKYDTNLMSPYVCVDVPKVNEYLYSVTNQQVDSFEEYTNNETNDVCVSKITSIIYMYDLVVNKVTQNSNKFVIEYTIKNLDNLLYNSKYNYGDLNIKKYNGTVILEKTADNRYIYLSNNVDGGKNF